MSNHRHLQHTTGPSRALYLASRSPRRLELLRQIGLQPQVVSADVDESALDGESPGAYVARLARAKAQAGWKAAHDRPRLPLLAADTAVVIDDQILGKPSGVETALSMLALLSGRKHQVLTAIALIAPAGQGEESSVETQLTCRTEVEMRMILPSEALAYWTTGEPEDKAGAYAIQGRGAVLVRSISGSYSNVVGLPLCETAALLREHGVDAIGP